MKSRESRSRCLSDDEVAAYVDGAIGSDLRKSIEEHLGLCRTCLHSVAELKHLVRAARAAEDLPAPVVARAESIVERELARRGEVLPGFEVVLALKSGICRIIETTGKVLRPGRLAPVTVRGDERAAPSPRVAGSLSGHSVTLELVGDGQGVQPRLAIADEASGERPDGIKARLRGPGASQTKYTRGGKIGFSPVGPGAYRIEIERIGTIELAVQ